MVGEASVDINGTYHTSQRVAEQYYANTTKTKPTLMHANQNIRDHHIILHDSQTNLKLE